MYDKKLFTLLTQCCDQAPIDVCFLEGPDFICTYINQMAQKNAVGRSSLGKPFLSFLPELEKEETFALIQASYRNEESIVRQEILVSLPISPGQMVDHYYTYLFQPWRYSNGLIRGVVLMALDVTETVLARRALEEDRRQQDDFFRMLSHDLRNPIGSAKMAMDSVLRLSDQPEKVMRKAKRASAALVRADQMISRFLDLRRLQAGGELQVNRRQQSLAEVLPPLIDEMNLAFVGRVELQLDDPAQGLWDQEYMARAIGNLVENAARYGAAAAPIYVRIQADAQQLAVRVRNLGPALTPQACQAMLTPSVPRERGEDSAQKGGWGMGLSLVHAVVAAHQGSVSLASDDSGTEVCLRFSRASLQQDAPTVSTEAS